MKRSKEKEVDGIIYEKGQVWRNKGHQQTYRLIESIWIDPKRGNEVRIMSRWVDEESDYIWPIALHDVKTLTAHFVLDPKGLE